MSTRTDSVLVGAYLTFPLRLGPDVTVERLAVRIGAAIQSAVDECERRQAMRIADAVAEEREAAKELANFASMLANEVLNDSEPHHKRETAISVLEAFYAYRARGQKA